MEILVRLLKEIHGTKDIQIMLKDISEQLRLQGYSETELDMALVWLTTQIEKQSEKSESILPSKGSVRVLHPVERIMLNADAYGYLLNLEQLGFVDADQIETIIERALSSGKSEITIQDVKMVIASLVAESEHSEWMTFSVPGTDDDSTIKAH